MKTMPGSILLGLEELLPQATRASSAGGLVRITAHIPSVRTESPGQQKNTAPGGASGGGAGGGSPPWECGGRRV